MSNNGTTNGHTANANIQRGFDIFHHTLMLGVTNTLSAKNVWRNSEGFTWNDIADSINSGKPLLLGFAGTSDSPYGGAHMTVCIGYRIEDDMLKVVVSDAHKDYYRTIKFNLSTYNDFISKVSVVQNYAA